ncbi:MAG: aromatic ring-hydroxylating dioxygenase subunit alpha [Deltaproteobacteria bacterium]|nr:aromatic ring-hydroxylating dioxygenase subunit alpha [Deltaproteobacteria bacterium]
MSRDELLRMARRNIAHVKADTIDQTPDVLRVPAANYTDPARFELERERVWKRTPLVLALSAELREPGDFRALEVAGVPVLLTRGSDGSARAFVNSCAHRGAQIAVEPSGRARRFVCPYHAWSYDEDGALVGVYARKDFGEVDPACHGLVRLPVAERAGLIWAVLRPGPPIDLDAFLCGYDSVLGQFDFASWHLFARRSVPGPNWKIAYDGYLDFYHLPILHKATFGTDLPNRALYDAFGPHQRVSFPNPRLLRFDERPEANWDTRELLAGVWTIFPHVSIATFDAGTRAVLVSQLFPGASVGESVTVQSYLLAKEPDPSEREAAEKMFELLGYVVREEDYATGLRQQRALLTGARSEVLFGRNEGGGQRFHQHLDRLLAGHDEGDSHG